MKFSEISPFIRSEYKVDVGINYLLKMLEEYEEQGLIYNPDFQRGHVWTEKQQEEFVEFVLRGGNSALDIYFNNPSWHTHHTGEYNDFVVVDGLQRLTAMKKFLTDELRVFGHLKSEFEDKPHSLTRLRFHVNNLKTKEEVLQWYLEMNARGTPHTKDELRRVEELLKASKK